MKHRLFRVVNVTIGIGGRLSAIHEQEDQTGQGSKSRDDDRETVGEPNNGPTGAARAALNMWLVRSPPWHNRILPGLGPPVARITRGLPASPPSTTRSRDGL